jgi:hypothetical protein
LRLLKPPFQIGFVPGEDSIKRQGKSERIPLFIGEVFVNIAKVNIQMIIKI